MSTATDELVNQALLSAIEAVKSTGNFVLEQAPDVIRQLILYKTAVLSLSTVGAIAAVIAAVIYVRRLWRAWKGDEDMEFLAALVTVFGVGLPGLWLALSTVSLLKILIAPKVWLLEYAAELIK